MNPDLHKRLTDVVTPVTPQYLNPREVATFLLPFVEDELAELRERCDRQEAALSAVWRLVLEHPEEHWPTVTIDALREALAVGT